MSIQENTDLQALKADIQRLERAYSAESNVLDPLTTGAPEVDRALPGGGLSRYGLHEILSQPSDLCKGLEMAGPGTGFLAGLLARVLSENSAPVLWCQNAHKARMKLYRPGLQAFGLDADRLILVQAKDETETLWAMEEGLRSGAVSAVVGELENPSHTAFRRLQLASERGAVPGFMHRVCEPERAAGPVASRWAVRSARSVPNVIDAPWLGRPRFDVRLVRAGGATPKNWIMEWNNEQGLETPGHLSVVGEYDDNAFVARPSGSGARRVA